jgi:choline-glycine betaine transporter
MNFTDTPYENSSCLMTGSIDAVTSVVALGASPFVFIVHLLLVHFLKALNSEREPGRE